MTRHAERVFRKILIANRGRDRGAHHPRLPRDGDRRPSPSTPRPTGPPSTCGWPTRPTSSGPPPSRESYLRIDRVLDVARRGRGRRHPPRLRLPGRERRPSPGPARRRGSPSSGPAARPSPSWARRPPPGGWPWRRGCPWCRGPLQPAQRPRRPARRGLPHRLPRDAEGGGGRRRQGHAPRDPGRRAGGGARTAPAARPRAPSATTASTSRRPSSARATSRSRSWPTATATPSTSSSASARSSAGTRR